MRIALACIATLLLNASALAQPEDSLEATGFYHIHDPEHVLPIDTGIRGLHHHNRIHGDGWEAIHLGNTGSPARPLHLQLPDDRPGFDLGLDPFRFHRHRFEDIRYYNTVKPYSAIGYSIGSLQENIFQARHAQNVREVLSFGVRFVRIGSTGEYANQRVTNTGFDLYALLRTPNDRYHLRTEMVFDRFRMEENGGIAEDFIATDTLDFIQPDFVKTNLNPGAETLERHFGIRLVQELRFGTVALDSINDSLRIERFTPVLSIGHTASFQRMVHDFADGDANLDFYGLFGATADTTRLFMRHRSIGNRVSVTHHGVFGERVSPWLHVEAGVRHDWFDVRDNSPLSDQNLRIDWVVQDNPLIDTRLDYRASGFVYLAGYNQGDVGVDGLVRYDLDRLGRLEATVRFRSGRAPRVFEEFTAMRTDWSQDLRTIQTLESGVRWDWPAQRLQAGLTYRQTTDAVFFGPDRRPVQLDGTLLTLRAHAQKTTRIWKGLHIENMVGVNLLNGVDAIEVPRVVMRHALFLQGRIFKGRMLAAIGAEMRWWSGFDPMGYFPATGQWTAQRETASAPPPLLDAFINVQVSSLRFFFRAHYVTQGLGGPSYYMVAPYAARGRSFAGGIRWRFFE